MGHDGISEDEVSKLMQEVKGVELHNGSDGYEKEVSGDPTVLTRAVGLMLLPFMEITLKED